MPLPNVVKNNIQALRNIIGSGVTRRTYLVNPEVCVIARLGLQEYKHTNIIEMNPGLGLWSIALQNHLKPKRHILLEPDMRFKPIINDLKQKYPGIDHIPMSGYYWHLYNEMFSEKPPPPFPEGFQFRPKTVPPEEGVNTDLLFTGNLTTRSDQILISQFMNRCALGQWVQQFGRVRLLLWTADTVKDRFIPKTVGARIRPALLTEVMFEAFEVAGAPFKRTGKGYYQIYSHDTNEESSAEAVCGGDTLGALHGTTVKQNSHSDAAALQEEEENYHWTQEQADAERAQLVPPTEVPTSSESDSEAVRKPENEAEKLEKASIIEEDKLAKQQEKARLREEKALARKRPEEAKALGTKEPRHAKIRRNPITRLERRSPSEPLLLHWQHPSWYELTGEENIIPFEKKSRGLSKILDDDLREGIRRLEEKCARTEEKQLDLKRRMKYEQYLRAWGKQSLTTSRGAAKDDDAYSRKMDPTILMWNQRPYDPLLLDEEVDFYPNSPVALLSFTPRLLDPFFLQVDGRKRENRFERFNYLIRHLFTLRSKPIRGALRRLCPGAEHLLEVEGIKSFIDPDMRVRVLSKDQFIALAEKWENWPFRPLQIDVWTRGSKDAFEMACARHSRHRFG